MNYRTVADIFLDYSADVNEPISFTRDREQFEKVSTIYWALDELYDYILIIGDPVEATGRFIRKMTEYMRKYPKTSARYMTAVDVAEDIRDIFRMAFTKGETISYE